MVKRCLGQPDTEPWRHGDAFRPVAKRFNLGPSSPCAVCQHRPRSARVRAESTAEAEVARRWLCTLELWDQQRSRVCLVR